MGPDVSEYSTTQCSIPKSVALLVTGVTARKAGYCVEELSARFGRRSDGHTLREIG